MDLSFKQVKSLIKYVKDMGVQSLQFGDLKISFAKQQAVVPQFDLTPTNGTEANRHEDEDELDTWSVSP